MDYNRMLSEGLGVLASIAPASQAAGTYNLGGTNGTSIKLYRRALFVVHVGALGTGTISSMTLQAAPTSGGSFSNVSSFSLAAVTSGAENIILAEIRNEALAAQALGPFLRLQIVVATAAVVFGGIMYGWNARYESGSDNNIAVVTQTVTL